MIFINTRVFNTNKPDYKKKADDNVRKLKEVMEKLVVSTPEPTATTTTGGSTQWAWHNTKKKKPRTFKLK